jgi:hypothetical protein
VNIRFCVQLNKTPTDTHEMMQIDYGDVPSNRSSECEWCTRYKDEREDLQDISGHFRTIQEAGILQPPEIRTQLQMCVKW